MHRDWLQLGVSYTVIRLRIFFICFLFFFTMHVRIFNSSISAWHSVLLPVNAQEIFAELTNEVR